MRLRAGKTGSGKGAGRMVAQAIGTARAVSAHATILVRGDSMSGSRAVVGTCARHGAQFSLAMTRNAAIERAIAAIPEAAWTPVRYPGAVQDPDTGAWISDAEVAEIAYTAFASTPDRITARLVVRRVKDARYLDALFPVWRYHPFFTNTDLPIEQADITHRQHAIIETVFADLIDGPLAHLPSGRFGANSPGFCARRSRTTCYAPPVCSPGSSTPEHEDPPCGAGSSTSRPDWPAHNADRCCTYPPTGPGLRPGSGCGTPRSDTAHPSSPNPSTPPDTAQPENTGKAGQTSSRVIPTPEIKIRRSPRTLTTYPSVDRGYVPPEPMPTRRPRPRRRKRRRKRPNTDAGRSYARRWPLGAGRSPPACRDPLLRMKSRPPVV